VDPQVYDWLLQARFHWQQLTREGIDRAEEYYRLASERDSTSAEAWFGRGQVWFMRVQQGLVSREAADSLGGPFLDRARRLDPTLSQLQSQAALEMAWGQWDWEGAAEVFQGALEADPTDSVLRSYYSHLLFYLNRDEEALAQMEEAVAQDPFNTLVQGLYAMGLNFLHRFEEAEAVLTRTRERDPEAPILLSTLRTTYHLLGRHEEAMEMWRASYRSQGDEEALEALESGYGEGGYSEALRAVADLFVERSRTRYVTPWQIATLLLRGGFPEPALEYLEEAFQVRDQNMPYISVDPIFDPLRDTPRFQALMDGLGLPR
jgi:tetratricopeptide (TPR) repeat protein